MAAIPQIKKKNILIIGYGSMGKKYEQTLKKRFKIFFHDKKKNKKKNFLKKLNYEKIKDFYFVVISTPPKYHKFFCEICVKANRDFIVEKPLFLNNKGWKSIIKQIDSKKLICQVAYPRREAISYNYIKNLIRKGRIGKLMIIKSNFSQDFRNLRKDYKNIYYSQMNEGGGIVYDALSHHINLLTYFMGKIKMIKKTELKLSFKDIQVNDTGILTILFEKKKLGLVFGNQFQKPNIDEIEFIGTNKNLVFNRLENKLFILSNKKKLIKTFNETYEDIFKRQIDNFLLCKRKRIQPKTTVLEEFENLSKLQV